ncbi:DUF4363 family protein [Tepidibacter sp. Z1-5]|uniref:DUF4363 family protein n=1 Tax=Tepidibacter sp. Z1-5 TaxID=3134138 RepID=UPI0030BC4C8B
MKSFIASIIATIIIIFSWNYIYNHYVDNYCIDSIKSLESISNYIDKSHWKNANNEILKLEKSWNRMRKTWSIFLDHHEIDNIDIAMAKLLKNIELKNLNLSYEQLQSLKEFFKIVSENEKLTLTNIL